MARVKRGLVASQKHKKLRALTKGYRGTRSKLTKVAHEAILHAGQYAYHGRKRKKRDFRRLWISRISQGVKELGFNYSGFINALATKNIKVDRKILSQILVEDPNTFKEVVTKTFAK